ncbi:MAG: Rne/Rng family ribonuclease [Betaproteobacteria bacterium]|nr:Rne/Rng family ribonuclease [Betaproteobacteria bacterium]
MKRMLFNATQAEELRVAIVDGQKLIDLDIESATKEQRKGNIYKGIITRIEPSLEAAFVDYGEERHGFLPFKAIARAYLQSGSERGRIQDILKEGHELIVQVDKDERGNKGAALSTFISLAGRYLVLMPNNPRGGGISRRVDGEERIELREIMDQLDTPPGMSLITRTAAIGRQFEELQWDLNYLKQLWHAIEEVARNEHIPRLIYQEDSLVIRAIRDYFQPEIGEILIDTDSIFKQARDFMSFVIPNDVHRVKRYWDDVPLFSRFQIEHQIETAFGRQVNLPSGGAVVIDHTEALVAIDVNSGRATRGADIEETAFRTNLEAAEEISRQLRLRDLGGLIVIDFIDMESAKNQREVEARLKETLKFDRARVQMGKISRFGLMELSRQRLRPALAETSYITCPRCTGTGHIRSTESAALHILRILEEESMKEGTAAVHVQVPVDVATYLLNEKRHDIQVIELRHKVSLLLIPNMHLETPAHSVIRLKHDDLNQDDWIDPSYRMVFIPGEEKAGSVSARQEQARPRQEAVLKNLAPEQPAPVAKTPEKKGLISRLVSLFMGAPKKAAPPVQKAREKSHGVPESRTEARSEKRDGRGENRRNKGRNENRREEREARNDEKSERPTRAERSAETRSRPARVEPGVNAEEPREAAREPRNKRERGERARPAIVLAQAEAAAAPAENSEAASQGNSRRGRNRNRGGASESSRRAEFIVQTEATSMPAVAAESPEPPPNDARTQAVPLFAPEDIPPAPAPVAAGQYERESFAPSPLPAAVSEAVADFIPAIAPISPIPPVAPVIPVVAPVAPAVSVAPVVAPATPVQSAAHTTAVTESLLLPPLPAETPVAPPPVMATPVAQSIASPIAPPASTVEEAAATLEESGLILVQTSQNSTSTPYPETKPQGRPRRKSTARGEEEPMVMVETRQ